MNVASKELCQELYAVSGWQPDYVYDTDDDDAVWMQGEIVCKGDERLDDYEVDIPNKPNQIAAYDLGYLLRKLQDGNVRLEVMPSGKWCATAYWYGSMQTADTPEDASCKLCIELFKQGVLTQKADK